MEEFVGVMARRSRTNYRRVLWIGDISSDSPDAKDYFFHVFGGILLFSSNKKMLPSSRRLYLIKEPNNEWYLGFRASTMVQAFDQLDKETGN